MLSPKMGRPSLHGISVAQLRYRFPTLICSLKQQPPANLSILDRLTARAAQTPPGQWVEGLFYDDTKLKARRKYGLKVQWLTQPR